MKKSGLVLLCATALVLSLAACAGPAPAPTASPSGSASAPSPSATPTPEAEAAAASVVISVEGFTILDTAGETIAEFGYFDADAADAVAALTEAFGAAPVETRDEARTHFAASANSGWSGFELRDLDQEAQFPDYLDFNVRASAAEVNGIEIRTTDGVYVGMALADVEPLSYRSWVDTGTGTDLPIYLLEQKPVETATSPDYEPAALDVVVSGDVAGGVVSGIGAPGANFGS